MKIILTKLFDSERGVHITRQCSHGTRLTSLAQPMEGHLGEKGRCILAWDLLQTLLPTIATLCYLVYLEFTK